MTNSLLADENIARQKVEWIRSFNFDILSISDLGLAGRRIPDATVLSLARSHGRIVLTHNSSDFKTLHRDSGGDHTGILILPDDVRHELLATLTAQLVHSFPEWIGRIEKLHRPPPNS